MMLRQPSVKALLWAALLVLASTLWPAHSARATVRCTASMTNLNFGSVNLVAGNRPQGAYPARNLSLSGLYLEGVFDVPVGESCRLELHDTNATSCQFYGFSGRISRRDERGIGVEFTSMGRESLMFLQTMVLYCADDPIGAASEFHEEFAPGPPPVC